MSSLLSNLVAGQIMELRKKLSCQRDSNSQPLEPLEPLTTAAQSNRSWGAIDTFQNLEALRLIGLSWKETKWMLVMNADGCHQLVNEKNDLNAQCIAVNDNLDSLGATWQITNSFDENFWLSINLIKREPINIFSKGLAQKIVSGRAHLKV